MLFLSLFSSIVSFIVKQRNQSQKLLAYIFEKSSCKAAYFVKRTDFKYENIIFKFHSKNYLSKAFLVPNLKIFFFEPNFTSIQTLRRWLQMWQEYFQIPAQRYPNRALLVPKLRIVIFAPNLVTRQIWWRRFQIRE